MNQRLDLSRRRTLTLLGGAIGAGLGGCCELRGFPKPAITERLPTTRSIAAPFLAPQTINTRNTPSAACVDVHAHFFNASDVTVKGYLEGPVAYSMPGVLGDLIRLLAPLGDALGEMAPTAKSEYDSLTTLELQRTDVTALRRSVAADRTRERDNVSVEFNRLIQSRRGKPFRDAYARAMQPTNRSLREVRPRIRSLADDALAQAMNQSETIVSEDVLRSYVTSDQAPYGEGILAFIGYMLSSRKSNLLTYQAAFTEPNHTIGVRKTLGLLVDFDHWLACPPRSAHEDQMKLHLKLSTLSSSYLLPVISYNPWTDVINRGQSLELVEQAVRAGFVAVKIYPPNGFKPWGNAGLAEPPGAPSGADIDAALQRLWLKCDELEVPVIAHADASMGSDAAHDAMGQPDSWHSLINASFWPSDHGPRVSLGHFGGDISNGGNDWTQRFAALMGQTRGQHIYGDLAYWDNLQCATVGDDICHTAENRLQAVLTQPLGNGQIVADRVMYGSDWFMLSRQKNWPLYAQQLHASLTDIASAYVPRIFGDNAVKCFGARLGLN